MNFSKVIPLPEGELTLILSTEEIRNPENLPAGSISLQVPSETKDFYVLLSSDISNISFPVRMELIPIGEGHLEPGETLWINYTNYIIQAVLGNKEVSLPQNAQAITKNPIPESGYYEASFSYQSPGDKESKRIGEQQWWFDKNSRHLGMIVDSGGRLPKIFFYRDFRQ